VVGHEKPGPDWSPASVLGQLALTQFAFDENVVVVPFDGTRIDVRYSFPCMRVSSPISWGGILVVHVWYTKPPPTTTMPDGQDTSALPAAPGKTYTVGP